jgi:hypothetical protein
MIAHVAWKTPTSRTRRAMVVYVIVTMLLQRIACFITFWAFGTDKGDKKNMHWNTNAIIQSTKKHFFSACQYSLMLATRQRSWIKLTITYTSVGFSVVCCGQALWSNYHWRHRSHSGMYRHSVDGLPPYRWPCWRSCIAWSLRPMGRHFACKQLRCSVLDLECYNVRMLEC